MSSFARWSLTLIMVLATTPAAAGSVGFLDTDRAIKTVKEGERQFRALDDWANQKSDEVEALRDRVTELTEQLNSQQSVASPDTIMQLEEDLLHAQRDFEDAGRSLKLDYEKKQRELLSQVATRVRTVASEYAEANDFDAVFMLEAQPLVYIADSAIITDAVIQIYNERFPID